MIDLDEFKAINDTLGHQVGDRLLREIARAILGAARDSDAVFRYGGDEFAVLLPRSDAFGVAGVAERIRVAGRGRRCARDHVGGRGRARVGLDRHRVVPGWTATTPEAILLAADRACFVAKRRGRGRVATALEGLALAAEFTLSEPTPVDPPLVDA